MEQNIGPFAVATYNIRTDTELDGPPGSRFRWSSRLPYLKQVFTAYDWDVVGIQEAREHQLIDLLELTGYDFVGLKRSTDEEGEYSPIFYKKTTFQLLETETKWLSATAEPNRQATEWGAAYPRVFTIAKLRHIASGEPLIVLNTHFDHVSEEARFQSARKIIQYIEQLDPEIPLLLFGDFNGNTLERWYQIMTEQVQDVRKHSPHHVGPDGTYRGVDFFQELKWDGLKQIDYIFCNQAVDIQKTETVTDQFQGLFPSDHFAFSANISLKRGK